MQKLTFITGQPAKAKYLREYFHISVDHLRLDLQEIQSLNLKEIAEDKARRVFDIVKAPVLVEDVSVVFYALKKLPGPLIKWFYETLGNDGLCKLLDGYEDRRATAEVEFALCDETGVYTFNGKIEGSIAPTPRGQAEFGWDPIFIPAGHSRTWAEMSPDEKHDTAMRKPALEKLAIFLAAR